MHKYHRAKLTPVGVHECYLVKLLSNIEYHVTIVFLSLETNKRRKNDLLAFDFKQMQGSSTFISNKCSVKDKAMSQLNSQLYQNMNSK